MDHIFQIPAIVTHEQISIPETDNGILIVLNETDLIDANRELLSKILLAVGHKFEECLILQLKDDQSVIVSQLDNYSSIKRVLAFGVRPGNLSLRIKATPYSLIDFADKSWIFSGSLSSLSAEQALKAKLWTSLKTMFAS